MTAPPAANVILVVDDNPLNLDVLAGILREHDCQVRVATNGRRGLEAARRAQPDLIMLDISMPEMDGFAVCMALKADPVLSDVPVIFISAHDEVLDKVRAFEVGAVDYVQKPFQALEVMARVQHQLRLRALRAALRDKNDALEASNSQLREMMAQVERSHDELEGIVVERTNELRERWQALQISEERYRLLVELAPEAIIVIDADTRRIEDANPNAERLFQCRRAELLDCELTRFYADKQPDGMPAEDTVRQHIALAQQSGAAVFERTVRGALGAIRHCEVHIAGLPSRDRRLMRGTFIDITERHEADAQLRAGESRHRAILNSALDAIVIMDEGGRLVEFNPAAEAMFGLASVDVVGRQMADLIVPPSHRERHERGLARHLATNTSQILGRRIEITAMRRDGTEFPVELSVQRIGTASPALFTAFIRDLSDHKRLEEQILQAQKMETVGQLAGGIAHDFNNLLTIINGAADLALMRLTDDSPLRLELEAIGEAGDRAAVLTAHLLAFSRKQILQPVVVNLNSVIDRLDIMLRRVITENIELVLRRDPTLGNVSVDRGQIEQVILNLAINSRDAMPNGGTLIIETQQVSLDDAYAAALHGVSAGTYAQLSISDSGTGMDSATMRRMFEPFFTTKGLGHGTGLGLSTAHGIIKQSGGEIRAFSEVGHGTTIKIFLPLVVEPVTSVMSAASALQTNGSETVLVVDDDEGICRVAKQMLTSVGYRVIMATSGDDALAAVTREHDQPLDLVLTDVVMPRMSGPELVAQLRLTHPRVRVLYTSGYTESAVQHHGVMASGVHFLSKPYDVAKLTRKVREVLDG